MNARIKRKLNKRIKHKLIDDLPLTEFEERYYLKQWKEWKASFNRRKQKQRLKLVALNEAERVDIIDAENAKEERRISFSGVMMQDSKRPIDPLTKMLREKGVLVPRAEYTLSNVAEPIKESKWSKVKNKVKGWFGK